MNCILKSALVSSGTALQKFVPEHPDNFHILLHLNIGPAEGIGGHDYTLEVCTPRFLEHSGQRSGPIWGRHLLIVNEFNAEEILREIERKRSTFASVKGGRRRRESSAGSLRGSSRTTTTWGRRLYE